VKVLQASHDHDWTNDRVEFRKSAVQNTRMKAISVTEFLARADISDEAKTRVREAGAFRDFEQQHLPCTENESAESELRKTAVLLELHEIRELHAVLTGQEWALQINAWQKSSELSGYEATKYPRLAQLVNAPPLVYGPQLINDRVNFPDRDFTAWDRARHIIQARELGLGLQGLKKAMGF
jgi:hypothetical protein